MRLAGIVLGLGLGGFVDGIALHQIMQWHNMGSAVLPLRCQPMGEPGRYSLMSAIANALASTAAHCAIVARSGNRNAGIGPAASRSYGWPKNATPRHDATPFEVRERDVAYGIQQDALLRLRDEVLTIVEAVRETVIEETR